MEEKDKKECEKCFEGCWHAMKGCGRKYYFLRWILGVIILLIVFWLGVAVGELKAYVKGDYGDFGFRGGYPEMMNRYGGSWNRGMMNSDYGYGYYGMPTMRQFYENYPQQQAPAPSPKQ